MKDLDFDELDRAVNSAINPQPATPAEPTPEPVVEPVASESEQPVVETPPVAPQPVNPTPSPAARRSSGRFMDVVHPSSDMRAKISEAPAPAAPQSSATTEPEPAVRSEESVEADQPLESPFIAGAKIEKRPLGGVPTDQVAQQTSDESSPVIETTEPESEPEKTEEPIADEAPAPEVSSEVLAVENQAVETPAPEPTPTLAPEEPTGPTSILQQYKEQPNTEPQPSGAIYDTESYHQPIAQPQKKLSAILIVLWMLGLIVIGGGIGAVAYFYVLPML